MKIYSHQLNSADLKSKSGALIHGDCHSSIRETSLQIIKALNDNYSIIKMDFLKVNKEPEILFLELHNLSIFKQNKIIILLNAHKNLSKDLQNVLNNLRKNFVLILSYEPLGKSPLRDYCETSKDIISIGCYQNNQKNILNMISQYLKKYQISYDNTVISYLHSHLASNTTELTSQMEKLLLYLGDKKQITCQDIDSNLFAETSMPLPLINDICTAIADGNLKEFYKLSDSIIENKISPIYIIRSVANYFLYLEKITRELNINDDINEAIAMLRPPIFFKLLPTLKKHSLIFTHKKILLILQKLLELEIIIKKHDYCQKIVFQHNIIKIMSSIIN